jgi:hypothetical protein
MSNQNQKEKHLHATAEFDDFCRYKNFTVEKNLTISTMILNALDLYLELYDILNQVNEYCKTNKTTKKEFFTSLVKNVTL